MSKSVQRFEQSSGWSARSTGGGQKPISSRPRRTDLGEWTCSVADGANPTGPKRKKIQAALAGFRRKVGSGKLVRTIECPFCRSKIGVGNIERHVRRKHRAAAANPLEILMDTDKTLGASFTQDLSDSDGDGLSGYDELVIYGTDPRAGR